MDRSYISGLLPNRLMAAAEIDVDERLKSISAGWRFWVKICDTTLSGFTVPTSVTGTWSITLTN